MRELDLADIQGGILRAYGRLGFPKARYFFLSVNDGEKGRRLMEALRPHVTTAARWVDPTRGEAFYAAIRTYWPGLRDGALQPGYAGIRPKISGPGEPAADFIVQGPPVHGVPGLVNLYGIESPGLTASLPLADEVVRELRSAAN